LEKKGNSFIIAVLLDYERKGGNKGVRGGGEMCRKKVDAVTNEKKGKKGSLFFSPPYYLWEKKKRGREDTSSFPEEGGGEKKNPFPSLFHLSILA